MADKSTLASKLGGTWFGAGLRRGIGIGWWQAPPCGRSASARSCCARERACETFGVLVSGLLGMQTLVPGRGTVTLMTVEPGDVYGWSALVPPHRSTSTVLGIEPGEALVFDAAELRDLLRDDESLAATLYPRLLQSLGRRLTATRFQLLDLYARERDYVPW